MIVSKKLVATVFLPLHHDKQSFFSFGLMLQVRTATYN